MALMISSKKEMCTRSKGGIEATDPEMLLRMEKLRQLREERVLHSAAAGGVRYDVAVTGRETPILPRENYTLSHSNNSIPTRNGLLSGTMCSGLSYKFKPDVFDGDVPLRKFLSQFELITSANDWIGQDCDPRGMFAGKSVFRFRWNRGNRCGIVCGIEIGT